MANELQLAAGLKLTNPAPADAYYCKPQVGQAPAQPYATPAEACSFVPQPLRYQGMTVNVAGVGEMSWLTTDLSDNGLSVKVIPGGPGGGGSPAIYADFIFTAENDGPQSFPLPAGTLGIVGVPSWFQPDTGQAPDLANYDFIDGNLVVYAATDVKAGDKFFGQRYYAGASGGPSGPISFDDITGTADVSQLPVADAAYIQQLYDALKPLINQDFVPR